MQAAASSMVLSPSRLSDFLACEHLTALDLRLARGDLERALIDDPTAELIRRKGDEHEARYLAELRRDGRTVVEIPFDRDLDAASRVTEKAIGTAEGDVIYQACLVDSEWR